MANVLEINKLEKEAIKKLVNNEKNDFNDLSSDENKIIVNILSWLSK